MIDLTLLIVIGGISAMIFNIGLAYYLYKKVTRGKL